MTEPLLLENHWLACMASIGGGARVSRAPGALVVTHPTVAGLSFNFIWLRGTEPGRLTNTLDAGSALLSEAGRPPALFLAPPAGDAAALAERLQTLGWKQAVRQVVLTRDLPGSPLPSPDERVAVEEVGAEALPLWADTLVRAYEVNPLAAEDLSLGWGSLCHQPGEAARARFYLASLAGRAAGTGLLWTRAEMAGLYCGAVMPDLRRHGVWRSTMIRRLTDARESGCHLALLQTEAQSPVHQLCLDQLGFRLAYYRELWAPVSALEYRLG